MTLRLDSFRRKATGLRLMPWKRMPYLGLLGILLLHGALAPAASHCVRAGAKGNGSGADWSNACPKLPDTLVRGDTYYVAAGTYPSHDFSDPEDGTTVITIKKAAASGHGPDAGWKKEYGEGVACWGSLGFNKSYYVFDGVTGSGRKGHGFEIFSPRGKEDMVDFYNAAHDVTIRHVHMHFSDRSLASGDGVYGDTPASNITVSYCYIHDIPRCPLLMRNWTNVVWENNWVARNKSTPEIHAEGVSTHGGGNFVFRNNVWMDIEGTAIIVNLDVPTHDWKIYGNIFLQTGDPEVEGLGHGVVSDNFGNSPINGLEFYNNTMVGIHGGASGMQFWCDGSVNIKACNNLWVRCENVAFNQVNYDYNQFFSCSMPGSYNQNPGPHDVVEIGDPFIDADHLDFHLRKPTEPGTALADLFKIDPEGRTRGAAGAWARGAFEFVAIGKPKGQ